MTTAAKKLKVGDGETLFTMLEQLEAIDFCDCSEDFEMLCSIASEVARIKRGTYHYIEFDGEFD